MIFILPEKGNFKVLKCVFSKSEKKAKQNNNKKELEPPKNNNINNEKKIRRIKPKNK